MISAAYLIIFSVLVLPLSAIAQLSSKTRGVGLPPAESMSNTLGSAPLKVGPDVTAPRATYAPDPKYSPDALESDYEGTVVLWVVVAADGHIQELKVARSIGLGLDEQAMAAVSQWRFNPARQHGTPVAVQINVEVNFRLPNKPNIRKLTERANAGDPKAQVKLATAYFLGRDVPKDPTLGLEWTRKAADQGLSLAQSLLGDHYYNNGSASTDYVSAYMWYALAAVSGHKWSAERLAMLTSKMSQDQISEAQDRVEKWQQSHRI